KGLVKLRLFPSLINAKIMENAKHPGVYIPPPFLYLSTFLLAIVMQNYIPLDESFFYTTASKLIGLMFVLIGLFFFLPAIWQFIKTKNTLITVKGANSLQTQGLYSVSRNPMYVGLLLFYTGLSLIYGNLWNLILLPLLF